MRELWHMEKIFVLDGRHKKTPRNHKFDLEVGGVGVFLEGFLGVFLLLLMGFLGFLLLFCGFFFLS